MSIILFSLIYIQPRRNSHFALIIMRASSKSRTALVLTLFKLALSVKCVAAEVNSPLSLTEEMLRISLAIYHLISNACSWNNR